MLGDSVTITQELMVTVVCMGVVFITLLILALVIDLFEFIFKSDVNVKKSINSSQDIITEEINEKIVLQELDNDDAVAAIAACIAASSEKRNNRIHIRSIRRVK